jgi:hypothetical protein
MTECQCKECQERREATVRIQVIKAGFPEPEWDWTDLEAQNKDYRDRVRRQFKRNGRWILPHK